MLLNFHCLVLLMTKMNCCTEIRISLWRWAWVWMHRPWLKNQRQTNPWKLKQLLRKKWRQLTGQLLLGRTEHWRYPSFCFDVFLHREGPAYNESARTITKQISLHQNHWQQRLQLAISIFESRAFVQNGEGCDQNIYIHVIEYLIYYFIHLLLLFL